MLVKSRITEADAIQYKPTDKDKEAVIAWLGDEYKCHRTNRVIFVKKGRNEIVLRPGDWLVRMPSGKFLLFDADEFREIFEVVADDTSSDGRSNEGSHTASSN